MIRVLSITAVFFIALVLSPVALQARSAQALIQQATTAMGGMKALGTPTNEMIESEGKHYDSSPNEAIRNLEVVDGNLGLLREGEASTAKTGRLTTRQRTERRAPAAKKSLQHWTG